MPDPIHHVVSFDASPQQPYEVLTNADSFALLTGAPAEIDPSAGGAFSLFGGQIVGRNLELVSGERLVQAWRVAGWDPGVYSVARFELRPEASGSVLVFDHTAFPEEAHADLDAGWHAMYWEPIRKHLKEN
jgi:activator of HSP90 ATPase